MLHKLLAPVYRLASSVRKIQPNGLATLGNHAAIKKFFDVIRPALALIRRLFGLGLELITYVIERLRLSIAWKLAAGFFAVLTLTLLLSVVALINQNQTHRTFNQLLDVESRIAQLALESSNAMLQARRAENDYLANYKELGFEVAHMEYVPEIQRQVTVVHDKMAEIRALTTDEEALARSQAIDQAISEYESAFLSTAEQLRQRGHNDVGLEGQFGTSVRAIEQVVGAQGLDQLAIDMLTMRRHEKDFLLRGEAEYVDQLHAAVAQFNTDVAATDLGQRDKLQLVTFAADYLALFDKLVATNVQIEESVQTYREAVQKLEPLVQAYQDAALETKNTKQAAIQETAQTARLTVIGVSLGAVLIGVLVAFVLSRSIARTVMTMAQAANGIAEGNIEQSVVVRSNDELGKMAIAFSQMVSYLKEMATAANRLAEGDLAVEVQPRSERDALGHAFRISN